MNLLSKVYASSLATKKKSKKKLGMMEKVKRKKGRENNLKIKFRCIQKNKYTISSNIFRKRNQN